ncbi:hypothetical protein EW145_g246 [Phellinidium pouzarii]|uniref:Fungal lipase-type domain-containing protein n=1 Tax=Phellinidium pouzarii TaxID=167371 RepID=A0A4S4LJ54_9AGAM|nr:hypothetical protein EW145_g246 [Phellinidium pouzarii]
MSRLFVLAIALSSLSSLLASPLATKRQSITTLSTAQITAFKPFTFFAGAANCDPSTTINWSCGTNCDANTGFLPTASGGDGTDTQFCKSAPDILSAVEKTLAAHPDASVTTIGHSLGAALALLDAVYLPLHLPTGTSFKTVTYGMPRVGNLAFADYVDAQITSLAGGTGLTHVNNKKDPVPLLPGRSLGFYHPSGEVHIQNSNAWDACPGQDNSSDLCIVGDVPNIFESDTSDHLGPYDGVEIA